MMLISGTIWIQWNDISCGKDFHVEALKAEIDPYLGGTQGWRKRGHSKESGKRVVRIL